MKRKKSAKDLKIEEQALYIYILREQIKRTEEKLDAIRQVFSEERNDECHGCSHN